MGKVQENTCPFSCEILNTNGAKMKKYKKVYVEITNICNLSCKFCPETNRQKTFMNKDRFLHVIKEIKPFTDYIYFHLMGEPLLHPELDTFLKICDEHSLKVNVTTNGTLLRSVSDILLNAPALRKVGVSLHSFEANEGSMELQDYLDDTVDFVKESISKGVICELRLWNIDSEGIHGDNNLNKIILQNLEKAFCIDFKLSTALKDKKNIKLQNNLFIHLAEIFEWPDIDKDVVDESVFCYGLRDQFGILVDGTVVPCCLDNEGAIALGNIFEQPLKDILCSDRAKKMYDGFSGRKAVEELCKKCGYATRYKL